MRFKYLSACFLVLLHTSSLANTKEDNNLDVSWSLVYLDHFDELFDQTEILKSEIYLNAATDEDRQLILENHFLNTKMALVVNSAKNSLGYFAVGIVSFLAIKKAGLINKIPTPNINPVIAASGTLSATMMGLSFFSRPIYTFSDWVTKQVTGAYTVTSQYITGTTSDALEKFERLYVRNKPNLPLALQRSIEEVVFKARTNGDSGFSRSNPAKLATKIIAAALSFPNNYKEVQYNRELFDKTFDCYNEDTKLQLRRLVISYIAAQANSDTTQKFAVYFKGEPGTGKTRAAGLLAKFLGVPFADISLAGIDKELFIGTRDGHERPGLVAEAAIRTNKNKEGAKNFVLLIDEVDRILNAQESDKMAGLPNYMLKYLDPSSQTYYNEFFEAYLEKPRYSILAGNFLIKDPALLNRLDVVNFGAISDKCKEKIVWEQYFPEIFTKYEQSKFQLKSADFTEEDRKSFSAIIAADTDPGMRSIYRELEHYIADIVLDKIEKKISDGQSQT